MDYRIVSKYLGVIALLIAFTMIFSLPWAFPSWGTRNALPQVAGEFETRGFYGLCQSILISTAAGLLLLGIGGKSKGKLFHKEAMAVVGFAWILATVLGALPYVLGGTYRGPCVRLSVSGEACFVHNQSWFSSSHWRLIEGDECTNSQIEAVQTLLDAGADGLSVADVPIEQLETLRSQAKEGPFSDCIEFEFEAKKRTTNAFIFVG